MREIPQIGIKLCQDMFCREAALTDPNRDSAIHEFAKILAQQFAYQLAKMCVEHSTYQGLKTGRMWIDRIILSKHEYNQLAMECYQQGLQDYPHAIRIDRAEEELAAAYAELRKQRPAITAMFDREVWDKAQKAGES